eukprot:2547087-Amphidinium_carterae.1
MEIAHCEQIGLGVSFLAQSCILLSKVCKGCGLGLFPFSFKVVLANTDCDTAHHGLVPAAEANVRRQRLKELGDGL